MPICTCCASVYLEEDIDKHICDPKFCPQKGEEIRLDGTKIDIITKEIIK